MHKIKKALMDELYEYEEKMKKSGSNISGAELEKIHKLTDTIKNICKIDMLEEEDGYSQDGRYMGEGRIYGTSYDDDYSMARGRGRNARRDSMGRYSSDDDYSMDGGMSNTRGGRGGRGYSRDDAREMLIEKAEKLMPMAKDEESKKAIKRLIKELEED